MINNYQYVDDGHRASLSTSAPSASNRNVTITQNYIHS